jgi:hypothetical protein
MIGNYNWFLAILSLHYHQKHRLSSPEKKNRSSQKKTMVDHPRKETSLYPWEKNGLSMRPAFY